MDPREPVQEAVLEQGRGGAQPGCSLVCHRSPDFTAAPPRSTSQTPTLGAGSLRSVGSEHGRRAFPQTAGRSRPRPVVKKSGIARMRPARPARRWHHRRSVQRRLRGGRELIQVERRATEMAEAIGLARRASHQEAQGTSRAARTASFTARCSAPSTSTSPAPPSGRTAPTAWFLPASRRSCCASRPRRRRRTPPDGQRWSEGYDQAPMADVAETLKRVPLFAGVKDRDLGRSPRSCRSGRSPRARRSPPRASPGSASG